MWLIDTATLELKFVTDPERGSYAILSHTWEGEEVTFDQLHNSRQSRLESLKQQKSFAKIARTCELASKHGLSYVWVDTCCIDKASSAELSEAINSMFKYYQDASFCVVFLSDLPKCSSASAAHSEFESHFPHCRWLTRGWTLQELIAPSHVFFYDSSWTLRGTKNDWKGLLLKYTGVDEAILSSPNGLRSIPVARRMSWASKRQTTRVEDMAYSLLGIFDVNMPLIYGEGLKAFRRLQEEIAKESCDLSLFAWQQMDASQQYRGILAATAAEFANCREIKHRIKGVVIPIDFGLTNRGLRMDTALVSAPAASDHLILNLGCSYRDDWPTHTSRGWLGVYLAKTQNGFVRAVPDQLFVSMDQERRRCSVRTVHIQKTVQASESRELERRFERALNVVWPKSVTMVEALPESLWVENNAAFLHQGNGINAYLRCGLRLPDGSEQPLIVGCSTMNLPVCTVWGADDAAWVSVDLFLKNSNERADFVAVDYLRLHFPSQSGQAFSSTSTKLVSSRDSRTSMSVSVEIKEVTTMGTQSQFVLYITAETR